MARSMRNVDLNLLSIFVALMHDQNLSHAAEHLGMTQPAVSQALKRLRSLYNDPLFERVGRKMMPTFKAEAIYPNIKKIMSQVVETLPEQEDFDPATSTHNFHMNILGIHHNLIVTNLIKEISQVAPGISLTISTSQITDIEKSLNNKEFDLHIDYLPNDQSGCHSEVLFYDELFVMARKNHPRLSDLTEMTPSQYFAEYHAVFTPRTDNRLSLVRAMVTNADSNFERKVRYKSSSALNIVETVAATDFICTLPRGMMESMPYKDDIMVFKPPFRTQTISGYMTWHWASQHYASQKWFRNLVLQSCKKSYPQYNKEGDVVS